MKKFESFAAEQLEEYLAYRQGLGYTDRGYRYNLRQFDEYAKNNASAWEDFKPSFFLQFQDSLSLNNKTINKVICATRQFCHFLTRKEFIRENPVKDIPFKNETSYVPFIFSDEDIDKLLSSVCRQMRHVWRYYYFNDLNRYMIILLLARCGLRISEPYRLMCHHYRPDEASLYIEKTKFSKDRLLPLPEAVNTDMKNYLSVRTRIKPDTKYFFTLRSREPVYMTFHKAVKEIGLYQKKRTIGNTTFAGPTAHSLRHSFAVNTLKNIRMRGESPQDALPFLASYMGHAKYESTAVYLKALDAEQRKDIFDITSIQLGDI
jgi:integrase/recombinase XerD